VVKVASRRIAIRSGLAGREVEPRVLVRLAVRREGDPSEREKSSDGRVRLMTLLRSSDEAYGMRRRQDKDWTAFGSTIHGR